MDWLIRCGSRIRCQCQPGRWPSRLGWPVEPCVCVLGPSLLLERAWRIVVLGAVDQAKRRRQQASRGARAEARMRYWRATILIRAFRGFVLRDLPEL